MGTQKIKNKSLLIDAFEVLMRNFGLEKTSQLWQILVPSKINYSDIRHKLFKGKGIDSVYKEAKHFNRK